MKFAEKSTRAASNHFFKEEIENTIISPGCRISLDFLWDELGLAREGQAAAH